MKGTETSHAGEPRSTTLQFQTNPPEHILVVEDDIFFRWLNTQVLVRAGYEVDAAADGAAAWKELNMDTYDLLITDNSMPKVTGVELLKKMRGARMALPVIMATRTLPTKEFARYPWLQPAATLLKPYAGEEILRAVKKVLREAECSPDGSQWIMYRNTKDNNISQAGEPASATQPCPTSSPQRILVVDKDSDLRRLYAEALAGLGYCVDAAEDGAAGWEALKAKRYGLLITEHEIPIMTGVELVKRLRAAHMALPVVMAAGRLPMYELARNPSLQLAATLSKPFVIDALLDTVRTVLRATDSAEEQFDPQRDWRNQPSANGLSL
jgi:DNA-binding response OmpR family regulator